LACVSGLCGSILKEQCGNIGKQIESILNCEKSLVWPPTAKKSRPFSTFPTTVLAQNWKAMKDEGGLAKGSGDAKRVAV